MNYQKEKAMKKIPFKIASKRTKSLGINFMKEVKDLKKTKKNKTLKTIEL